MYVKVRKPAWGPGLWDYVIYSDKKRIICVSKEWWATVGGAARAAIKLATDLGIEFRER